MIFLGYCGGGYRFWDDEKECVYQERDVVFHEGIRGIADAMASTPTSVPFNYEKVHPPPVVGAPLPPHEPLARGVDDQEVDEGSDDDYQPDDLPHDHQDDNNTDDNSEFYSADDVGTDEGSVVLCLTTEPKVSNEHNWSVKFGHIL